MPNEDPSNGNQEDPKLNQGGQLEDEGDPNNKGQEDPAKNEDQEDPAPPPSPFANNQDEKEKEGENDGEGDEDPNNNYASKDDIRRIEVNNQINDLMGSEEGKYYKDFEDRIREVAKQPQARGLTFDAIVDVAVGRQNMLKIGAQMEREASTKANNDKTGGNSSSPTKTTDGVPDVTSMSREDVEKLAQQVKTGGFNPSR